MGWRGEESSAGCRRWCWKELEMAGTPCRDVIKPEKWIQGSQRRFGKGRKSWGSCRGRGCGGRGSVTAAAVCWTLQEFSYGLDGDDLPLLGRHSLDGRGKCSCINKPEEQGAEIIAWLSSMLLLARNNATTETCLVAPFWMERLMYLRKRSLIYLSVFSWQGQVEAP